MAEKYKLTYFNVRGLGEPIRFTFVYAGVEYEDNRIEVPDWPAQKKKHFWGKVPVLQVGNKVLNESLAISRYLAEKFNLVGENEWEAAKMDELVAVIYELRDEYRKAMLEKDERLKEKLKEEFLEKVGPNYLAKLEGLVGKEGVYSVGRKLSWADFQVACHLEWFMLIENGLDYNPYRKLRKIKDTVFKIPEIKQHIETRPQTMF